MTLTMYDSVDVSAIPANAQAVAGYVSGNWPNFNELVTKFPNAHHLSIAPEANQSARCLDIEPLDATNDQAPDWFRNKAVHKNGKPVLYTSASNVDALIQTMSNAGIKRDQYFVWSAHYTGTAHICGPGQCQYPKADGTQWTDLALGRNLDQSLMDDAVFGVTPKPKPAPKPVPPKPGSTAYYDHFDNTPRRVLLKNRRERGQVELYDKLRAEQTKTKHPHRLQLAFIREVLRIFANRVYTVAHNEKVNGKPSWDVDNRGWRYQQLIGRAAGKRYV